MVSEVHSHSKILDFDFWDDVFSLSIFLFFHGWFYIVVYPLFHLFTH